MIASQYRERLADNVIPVSAICLSAVLGVAAATGLHHLPGAEGVQHSGMRPVGLFRSSRYDDLGHEGVALRRRPG